MPNPRLASKRGNDRMMCGGAARAMALAVTGLGLRDHGGEAIVTRLSGRMVRALPVSRRAAGAAVAAGLAAALLAPGAPTAQTPPTPAAVTGKNVTKVVTTDGAVLRAYPLKRWIEELPGGKTKFDGFVETGRNDLSVHLHDAGRDIKLLVDLHAKKVIITAGANKPQDLYQIKEATAVVDGHNAVAVTLGGDLAFRMTGPKSWHEEGKSGAHGLKWAEASRDDWTVTLHEGDRQMFLDLWKKEATLAETGARDKHFSAILGASATSYAGPPSK